MPVKVRTPKRRRPTFSPEALALFANLERMPQRGQKFGDCSHQLARLVGLTDAWWTGDHVNDHSDRPCHPVGYLAFDNWHRCRRVRLALLAAAKEAG